MNVFREDKFDISPSSNESIADLEGMLNDFESGRSPEQMEIEKQFDGVYTRLYNSLNAEQQELLERYQEQLEAEQYLDRQSKFICGFKTAMRLTFESLR